MRKRWPRGGCNREQMTFDVTVFKKEGRKKGRSLETKLSEESLQYTRKCYPRNSLIFSGFKD